MQYALNYSGKRFCQIKITQFPGEVHLNSVCKHLLSILDFVKHLRMEVCALKKIDGSPVLSTCKFLGAMYGNSKIF